jgi:hypothetical protein
MVEKLVKSKDSKEFMEGAVMLLVMILINTLILKFVWNAGLVKHISILSPIDTMSQALLMSIGLTLLK